MIKSLLKEKTSCFISMLQSLRDYYISREDWKKSAVENDKVILLGRAGES